LKSWDCYSKGEGLRAITGSCPLFIFIYFLFLFSSSLSIFFF